MRKPIPIVRSVVVDDDAGRINEAHRRCQASTEEAQAIGEGLLAKKEQLGRGGWLAWARTSLEFDVRTAQR